MNLIRQGFDITYVDDPDQAFADLLKTTPDAFLYAMAQAVPHCLVGLTTAPIDGIFTGTAHAGQLLALSAMDDRTRSQPPSLEVV